MSIDLDSFMQNTEDEDIRLVPQNKSGMQYPFLYLTSIADVEIKHLVEAGVLSVEPIEGYLPLFLRIDGYRLLGYVKLNFDTVIQLNYLKEHDIKLKASKDSEMSISESLFENLLLTR